MFKKTRLRLVALNAVVFFLILNVFGGTLFFYMQHHVFADVDQQLHDMADHMQREQFRDLFGNRKREHDANRRDVVVAWDASGRLLLQSPEGSFGSSSMDELRASLATDNKIVEVNNQHFRTLAFAVDTKNVQAQYGMPVAKVVILFHVEPEIQMLHILLIVIGAGSVASLCVAFFVGGFLADRALIPIQKSWNKQQQFVADASHELRTPLAVTQVHLERLFRHPDATIEEESDNISEAIRETKRMSKLVADLLTLARSDSNQAQILQQQVALDHVVERVASQFRQLAVMKDIEVEAHVEGPIEMAGDEERLHQLFVILLDNALKYTGAGGRITVSCKQQGSQASVVVSDTGAGISKEDLPFIFDRFFRGDKARDRSEEGTGLGLSIAKWIIESHGGKVRAESEPGRGTTVSIQLPLRVKG